MPLESLGVRNKALPQPPGPRSSKYIRDVPRSPSCHRCVSEPLGTFGTGTGAQSHLVMAVKLSACQLVPGKISTSHALPHLFPHIPSGKLAIFPKPLEECQLPSGPPIRRTKAWGPSAFSDLLNGAPLG